MTSEQRQIGHTILKQLGGTGMLTLLLGAKRFLLHEDGVSFKFPNRARSKPNFVRVALSPLDTYTVQFCRVAGNGDSKDKGEFKDVYCDQLKGLIEDQTGLYLSFT